MFDYNAKSGLNLIVWRLHGLVYALNPLECLECKNDNATLTWPNIANFGYESLTQV